MSVLQHLTVWILQQSSALHAELVDGVRAAADSAGMGGAAWLIGLAFLYGVFHAAGPGHGKAVIATYLATQRERLVRGVALAVLGALCQGLTAILLVYGLIGLAGWHWPDKLRTTEEELAFEREHGIPVRPNGSRIVSQWAMNLLILIVAIAFTCLLFSYFYIRVESPTWPTDGIANPGLRWPIISSLLLVISGGAMWWARRGIENERQGQLRGGLAAVFVLGGLALGLLINDFRQAPFTIGTNAYGSLFYTINGFIFVLVIAGLLQNIYTQVWAWAGRYTAREHVAIDVTGVWWWATIVFWLIAVGVVYVGPYVI